MTKRMVNTMIRVKCLAISVIATIGLVACSSDEGEETAAVQEVDIAKTAPVVSFKPRSDDYDGTVAKPGSPFGISYRIVGAPIIGSPVTIDLRIVSAFGPQPMSLTYRINDATAMMFGESQLQSVNLEPAANETSMTQQVIVIPLREGRLYLNVSASFETEDGTISTVTAIPIQVGTGTRVLQEHGEVEIDEDGEAVRVLSGD